MPLLKRSLIRRFMRSDPITIPPTVTVEQLVEEFIYRFHHKMFPVFDGDRLLGCVTTADVRDVPRNEWTIRTVGEIVRPCNETNTIHCNTDAVQALATMSRSGSSRLMVVDDHRLCGMVTLKGLLKFIELKVELDDELDNELDDSDDRHQMPQPIRV